MSTALGCSSKKWFQALDMSAPTDLTRCILATVRSGFLIPPKKNSFSFSLIALFELWDALGPVSLLTSPACQALLELITCSLSVTGGGVFASLLFIQFIWSWLSSWAFVCIRYRQNSSCTFCLKTLTTKAAYLPANPTGYTAASAVRSLPSKVTWDTQDGHWHLPLSVSRPCSLPAHFAGFHHLFFPSMWMQLLKFAYWASYFSKNCFSSVSSHAGTSGPLSEPGGFSSVATSPTRLAL